MGIGERKIAANRQNAEKSTGPRTVEGKAVARFNAIKHGILSQGAVLSGENVRDLEEIGKRLRTELRPSGELEVILVDRVTSCLWRLRRAVQAETAEIDRSRIETLDAHEAPLQPQDDYGEALAEAEREHEAVQEIIDWLKAGGDPFDDFDDDSPLVEAFDALADRHFREVPQDTPAVEIRDHARAQGWTIEKLRHSLQPILEGKAREARAALRRVQVSFRNHEKRQDECRCLSLVAQGVPAEETLNRLLRYETTIERQLYRALHELQRLQASRAGHRVPVPVAVDVDVAREAP